MREKVLIDKDWLFCEDEINAKTPKEKGALYTQSKTERARWGPACKDYIAEEESYSYQYAHNPEKWVTVDLPHDYIITQTPSKDENNALGFFKYKNAWYRKTLYIPSTDKDRRLSLLFDGVATNCTIYVNGCLMKHNFCGYTSFEVDITDVVKFDADNVISVYVDATHFEGWWYNGGGIYRHVWLIKTDTVAVDLWGLYAMPRHIDGDVWSVPAQITVLNAEYSDVSVTATCKVIAPDGTVVASESATGTVPMRDKADIKCPMTVNNPELWDIDNPTLYTVTAEISVDGVIRDAVSDRTGFRTFLATPDKGLFLNGKHVLIKGVCAHQDFGLTGKAVPDNIQKYKIQLIKEMGANGYRCSHYPHHNETMDALDELGFIVMAETRWFESTDEGLAQLEMLIKRDRNRPSVCFWSMGNEEPFHITEQGRRICKAMIAHTKKFDDSRYIMSAVSNDPDIATVYDEFDILGVNYNLDKYDGIHEKYPNKPIFASECCATGTTRGWYADDSAERGYMSAYDKDASTWFLGRERTNKFFNEREWIMGGYQWIAVDHRGETVWPRLCSQSGAIDLFLQRKDAFYQNQAFWIDDKPIIHLMPHWNFAGYEGEPIRVWAYTNCDEAELFLNGESLGKKSIEKYGHGEWSVPYSPGTLSVKGYINGEEVTQDSVTTTKKASNLMLRLENEVSANGCDMAFITCYCTDEDGLVVPDACPTVSFHTNSYGKIAGTGSDVSDHTPVTSPIRKMRAGLISVAVKVGEEQGALKVYAQSENLNSAALTIDLD